MQFLQILLQHVLILHVLILIYFLIDSIYDEQIYLGALVYNMIPNLNV